MLAEERLKYFKIFFQVLKKHSIAYCLKEKSNVR